MGNGSTPQIGCPTPSGPAACLTVKPSLAAREVPLRYWQRFLKYAVALGGWCAGVDGPSDGASMMTTPTSRPESP
jgi:hypothetical protein